MDRSAEQLFGASRRTNTHSALAILIAAAVAGCSSSGATGDRDAHATGTLALVAVTAGQDPGAGYAVFVDSGPALLLLANGTAGPDTGLSAGPHTLTVSHVPSNCSVRGGNVVPVTVVAHTQVADTVSVTCTATTRRIIFGSNRDGPYDEYLMNADGSQVSRLTSNGAYHASYSPDGAHLVYLCPSGSTFAVCTMNVDGSDVLVLSPYSQFTGPPEWSPDGRTIAYVQAGRITTVKPDGSGAAMVGPFNVDLGVGWSPDAQRLAFSQSLDSATEQVFVMNADGSHVSQLTTDTSVYSAYPQWSPDGKKILFLSPRVTASDVYVMNADGSDTTRVSNIPGSQSSSDAAWSPDGSQIAFRVIGGTGHTDIFVMNADGGSPTNITNSSFDNYGPNWHP